MRTSLTLLLSFFLCVAAQGQEHCLPPLANIPVVSTDQPGGLYLSSQGSIHALIIFAQFPDDTYKMTDPKWPIGQAPADMNQWVDEVWPVNDIPTPGTLTDYYHQMSMKKLKFTGTTRSVTVQHTRQWYMNNNMRRADIHAEIIQTLDPTIDFSPFDQWNPEGAYDHINEPDKIVDLVIVIWRNIDNDKSSQVDKNAIIGGLDFGYLNTSDNNYYATDEASLGYYLQGNSGYIPVDIGAGNRKVGLGYGMRSSVPNEPAGAGATIVKNYLTEPRSVILKVCIHEIAHVFLGTNSYHIGFCFWGMLASHGIRNFVPNSFERHRLGWITLNTVSQNSSTLLNRTLPDYITTGVAYRYIIDAATDQYFYIENHQGISNWDRNYTNDPSLSTPMEKGVYVIRQDKLFGSVQGDASQAGLVAADGRFNWSANTVQTHPCCGSNLLPYLIQEEPNRHTGYTDCELISYRYNPTGQIATTPALAILLEGPGGAPLHENRPAGDNRDAFRMNYQQVFSPWSNPSSYDKSGNSTGFGFELVNAQSTANGDIYTVNFYSQTVVNASPAKMQAFKIGSTSLSKAELSWQENEEPDLQSYKIYRAIVVGGTEPPISAFQLIATIDATDALGNPVTSWVDNGTTTGSGSSRQYYKISAVDNTGKESVKTTTWISIPDPPIGGGSSKQSAKIVNGSTLCTVETFPNPVNDELFFNVNLSSNQYITLQLFDILGSMVATVTAADMPTGEHTLHYNTSTLSDGCYIYRIQIGTDCLSGTIVIKKK